MTTRSEAIQKFLPTVTHSDLAALYSLDMECQVNVAQDGGERVDGEFKGKRWAGWSDGVTSWKPFRIPFNAGTNATYTDSEIKFDLPAHAEAIGMTGWDWKNKCSRWIAFDFDSLIGHKKGLSADELKNITDTVSKIPWITIRRSTSGQGLHLYIFLEPTVETQNHTEHSALARAILGQLCAITGFDLKSKVDTCGGNMWIWHRKMRGTNGLELLKQSEPLREVPTNWRDHVPVISYSQKKTKLAVIKEPTFDELCGQHTKVPLDDEHKKLIDYLSNSKALWWWDQDRHLLVCHTYDLAQAHKDLGMKGIFNTLATGKEKGADQNCFVIPVRRGAWVVRRHTRGVQEASSWEQDNNGWTKCFLNREPDLRTASRSFGGIEDEKGNFVFREAEMAIRAAAAVGVHLDIPPRFFAREAKLKVHKDGRLVIKIKQEASDSAIENWLSEKGSWTKIQNSTINNPSEPEIGNYDDLIRHLVTEPGDDYGWLIFSDNTWRMEPIQHIKLALEAMGHNSSDVKIIMGSSVFKAWVLVNKPFQSEYPGNREWNKNAAQLKFVPTKDTSELHYETWWKILVHCGEGLNETIKENGWCKANGILTGADYLKCWIASMIQEPTQPLPYLFMYGPQDSGKSSLHEAIELLLTCGYQRADHALTNPNGFNGELENAVLCVVEETDVNKSKTAYNRIKDWVTSRHLNIRKLYHTPYHNVNTTHWIQCSNPHTACPIFPGDTRITMMYVGPIEPTEMIPKKFLIPKLEKEAPDFLASLLELELPESNDRLNVPVITTSEKLATAALNMEPVQRFITENCYHVPGEMIKFSEFYEKFVSWLDPMDVAVYTKIRVGRELPPEHPRGRVASESGQFFIGNICWTSKVQDKGKIILKDGMLRNLPL